MTESFVHADFKSAIYYSKIEDDDYAEMEKPIGRTRTDVLTDINGKTVAIEIQHTRIPIKSIVRRMKEHTAEGFYTLWLITKDALVHNDVCRNMNWIKFIQEVHNGIIFIPYKNQTIIPARIAHQLKFDNYKVMSGRKLFLNLYDPIELSQLDFIQVNGLNSVTYNDEWWSSEYVDLLYSD